MSIVLFSVGLITIVTNILFGLPLSSILLSGVVIVITLLCLFISVRFNKTVLASIILTIFVNDICLPFLYFTSDGMNSGMPIWMVLGLVSTLLLLRKKTCVIVFVINAIVSITTIVAGYLYPMLFTPMPSEFAAVFDMLVAFICVTVAVGFFYKYSTFTFEEQQKRIIAAVRRADQANLIKSEFLSNISHDIRTPMNAIVGYSEIARQNCDDRKKLMDCFEKISIASDHLLELINGILDMSRLEMGGTQLLETECSIQQIVNDVADILENQMIEKQIDLQLDYSEVWEDKIIADKVKLTQILQNILLNAVQYSNNGGKIFISVKQPEIDDEQGIAKTEIRIKDEGCGVSKEFLEKIFEPFERERTVGKTEVSGIGLGLSICRKLIQMMNGKINIESEEGKGTEVFISIPLVIQTLMEIAEEVPDEEILISGKRILIVEDNTLNREIVKDMLESAGCIVEEAKDGSFAVDMVNLAGHGYYDLILMDIQMPIMDGYEATRIIRSFPNESLSKIPIVALSANAFPDDKKKAFDSGMDAFISKPVSADKLARVINVIFNSDIKKAASDEMN
ncbi:ATP-binding protein [Treponema sp. C6A8]|uniref:ATP-binding protein n=1 Tax=Treponema sp. C6A8 TaxID=1410609 RepID=UPI0018CC1595|nr:ATP-binding protein [Treponema sp. C6A8]